MRGKVTSKQTGNRTVEEAQSVIENGHPPMADRVASIDFDGTLYPFGYLFDFPPPKEGAVAFMRLLKKSKFKIIIFTSRLDPEWLESVKQTAEEHIKYITEICNRDGIPFDVITKDKKPSEFYVDDKMAPFHGNWDVTMAWFRNKYLDI